MDRRLPGRGDRAERRHGDVHGLDGDIRFANGQQVTQAWNATVTQSGSTATARNVAWNGSLAAGATASFGFLASWTGTNAAPAVTCSFG